MGGKVTMITSDLIGFFLARLYALQPQKFRESGELIESSKKCVFLLWMHWVHSPPCNSAEAIYSFFMKGPMLAFTFHCDVRVVGFYPMDIQFFFFRFFGFVEFSPRFFSCGFPFCRTGRVLFPWRRLTSSVRHCWGQSRAAHRAALSMALQETRLLEFGRVFWNSIFSWSGAYIKQPWAPQTYVFI